MFRIDSLEDGLALYKALGSETRAELLEYILRNPGSNMRHLAQTFHLSGAALSQHMAILEECGLVSCPVGRAGKRGLEKNCYAAEQLDRILINLALKHPNRQYQAEIPVGQYTDFSVRPTCGLASAEAFIGWLDDPRYFTHPDRGKAGILWFSSGYVEYMLPNLVPEGCRVRRLGLSFELSSEAPTTQNEWPSDISFFLNGIYLGGWRSPGDFGDVRGKYNPSWWHPQLNQYGLLKHLTVNEEGTYLDGERLSQVSVRTLGLGPASALRFRFCASENAVCPGGLTLFGRGFGNHNCGLRFFMDYDGQSTHTMRPAPPPRGNGPPPRAPR